MLRPPSDGVLGGGVGSPPPEPEPPHEDKVNAIRRKRINLFICRKRKLNT
tara:strand:- start:370 stop:519 length:150 start_codon:yes stop_codon:yes gene_type:complete